MKLATRRLFWLAFLALTLVATGCGGAAPAPTAAPAKPAAAPPKAEAPAAGAPALSKEYKLAMATGSTSGVYYPFGGAMATHWSKNLKGVTVTVEATGASVENMRLLDAKSVELAMVQNDTVHQGFNGIELFDKKIPTVRGVAALYPELIHVAVSADSGIKTVKDLKGKRVAVGGPGSGQVIISRQILEGAGLTFQDLGKAVQVSYTEGVTAFKDRQIDAFVATGGVPFGAVTDISTILDMRIIPLDGEVARTMIEKYGFYVSATIPGGSYRGQAETVQTVAGKASLLAGQDIDTDLVYWLTRTLFDKQADLAQVHAKAKEFTRETAVKGLTIPWHPGAERYYKEIGVLK